LDAIHRNFEPARHLTTCLAALAGAVSWCARQRAAAWLVGWCLAACLVSQSAWAQTAGEGVINREYPLKALFLYNFGGYVEWPPATFGGVTQPFVIGIMGSSPVESTLQEIAATRRIDGRQIVVEHFASADAIRPCQILFIARDVDPRNRQLAVERMRNREVLIVGESRDFAQHGAVANFFIEANKIRFEINVEAAKQHHLKISAKLLALAKIVDGNGVDGG
jgi:YfiR/HmsC-like